MANVIQTYAENQVAEVNPEYRPKRRTSTTRLRRPWSYGRAYVVMAGVSLLVLSSLGLVYLYQFGQKLFRPNT